MLPVFNNGIISHSWARKQTPKHLSLSCPASNSSHHPSISSRVAPHPEHLVLILERACLCFKHRRPILNLPSYACLMLFWFIAGLPLTPFLFFGLSDPASDHEHPSAYLPLEITWVPFFDTQHATGGTAALVGQKCAPWLRKWCILPWRSRPAVCSLKVFKSSVEKWEGIPLNKGRKGHVSIKLPSERYAGIEQTPQMLTK